MNSIEINKKKVTINDIVSKGCYGEIFDAYVEGQNFILKVYDKVGFATTEYEDLLQLKNIGIKVPEVISIGQTYINDSIKEYIMMEKINSQKLSLFSTYDKDISNKIIEVLTRIHNVVGTKFKYINYKSSVTFDSWKSMYEDFINEVIPKYRKLIEQDSKYQESYDILVNIKEETLKILDCDVIPTMIHGDFTPWNILVDEEITIIDPFRVRFADRELELIQLEKANGKMFKLLENYNKEFPISDNYQTKKKYYILWNEAYHNLNSYKCSASCVRDCYYNIFGER